MANEAKVKVKATDDEIQEGLRLLAKKRERDEKIARGEIKGSYYKRVSEMTPEQKAKAQARQRRQTARTQILHDLAIAKGLDKQITEEMITERVARMGA